jgi:hypothetical protein
MIQIYRASGYPGICQKPGISLKASESYEAAAQQLPESLMVSNIDAIPEGNVHHYRITLLPSIPIIISA